MYIHIICGHNFYLGSDREKIKEQIAMSIRLYLFGTHYKLMYYCEDGYGRQTGDVSYYNLQSSESKLTLCLSRNVYNNKIICEQVSMRTCHVNTSIEQMPRTHR